MHKLLPCLLLLILASACNQTTNDHSNPHKIRVVEARGYVVPQDSLKQPEVILAVTPEPQKADAPIVNLTNADAQIEHEPKIVQAGIPKVNVPGSKDFLLPKAIPAIGKTKIAGIPEVVIAKDATAKDVNPANFSIYKTLQGIKHNAIRSIIQDKTGCLWIGTNGGGVCKYDGKSFTNFTEKEGLSSNVVLCMVEDQAGNMWFGTYGAGLCRYDGKIFTSFTENEGLTNNVVFCIFEDKKGNIWSGTNNGVSLYDGKSFTNFTEKEGLIHSAVHGITEDKEGNIWLGTDGGACCYDIKQKSFSIFTEKEGLSNNAVYSVLEDKRGTMWFATNGGICSYDKKTFTTFTQSEGLVNNVVVSILEEKSGSNEDLGIWFGTNGGVSRFNGKSFTNFTVQEGLSHNVVLSLLEDRSGQLWFGTLGGGVCRYNGKSFINYSEREGLSTNVIYSICEDRYGDLWFGTDGKGMCRYNGKSFSNFTEQHGIYAVNSILESKVFPKTASGIWFDTDGGICRYDGTSFYHYSDKEGLNSSVLSMSEDREGNLWIGTNGGGICRYDGNRVEAIESGDKNATQKQDDLKRTDGKLVKSFTYFSESTGLVNNIVYSILQDKAGNMWFGTQRGVSRYDGKTFTNFTEQEGLSNGAVFSMLEDKGGNLWFGTNGSGACRYDGKYFTHFTEKEGLCNNAVLNVFQDADDNIWFGTRKGLSKFTKDKQKRLESVDLTNPQTNFDPVKEALFYNYGYNDGFLGLNCRKNSVLQDSRGRIWWGADLLTCYDPKGDIADTAAPVVNLTSVKLFGEEISWSNLNVVYTDSTGNEIVKGNTKDTLLPNGILLKDIQFDGLTKWNNLPEHLSLPYNNNNLTFNFIGVHLQSRNHIKYQYKLEGIDPEWSSITNRTEAPYGNLPAGDYNFKIKAMNQSGVWSAPFEFAFVVRPPWWQTWWFRFIVFAFIISAIWFYIKRRERKLKEEKEILEQTVVERTAEVVEEKKIVEQKNVLVEAQKNVIEEKHREITDSINYAERIQRSFMATKELLDENLKDYFVFFKPKAVVSGDFYWASKLVKTNGEKHFLLATADSTGHGVPGAIMSLLNISSLEKSVEHETEPAAILNSTRKIIIDRLKNDGSREGGKDGMDCSLISINYTASTLTYAASNNPVWIIRDGKLNEYKPDKMPVGKHDKDMVLFTQHTIDLKKGDIIYTFTDGIPDQFGGPKGKKFMYKQLKELLISLAHEPMEIQKQKLQAVFNNWKGQLEQIDDVCLIGVRI